MQKSLKREEQVEKNKRDLEAKKSMEREAKAARRKGRAEAARRKREKVRMANSDADIEEKIV